MTLLIEARSTLDKCFEHAIASVSHGAIGVSLLKGGFDFLKKKTTIVPQMNLMMNIFLHIFGKLNELKSI